MNILGVITLLFSLELGYTPYLDTETSHYEDLFTLNATPRLIILKNLHIQGTISIPMLYTGRDKTGIPSFQPFTLSSLFTLYYKSGPVSFGLTHQCTHPIITWSQPSPLSFNNAYTTVFLKLEVLK